MEIKKEFRLIYPQSYMKMKKCELKRKTTTQSDTEHNTMPEEVYFHETK